jgi:hypothetical protein
MVSCQSARISLVPSPSVELQLVVTRPLDIERGCVFEFVSEGEGKHRVLLDFQVDWFLRAGDVEVLPALGRIAGRFQNGVGDMELLTVGWKWCRTWRGA